MWSAPNSRGARREQGQAGVGSVRDGTSECGRGRHLEDSQGQAPRQCMRWQVNSISLQRSWSRLTTPAHGAACVHSCNSSAHAPAIMRPLISTPSSMMACPSIQTARYRRCLPCRSLKGPRRLAVRLVCPVGLRWKQRPAGWKARGEVCTNAALKAGKQRLKHERTRDAGARCWPDASMEHPAALAQQQIPEFREAARQAMHSLTRRPKVAGDFQEGANGGVALHRQLVGGQRLARLHGQLHRWRGRSETAGEVGWSTDSWWAAATRPPQAQLQSGYKIGTQRQWMGVEVLHSLRRVLHLEAHAGAQRKVQLAMERS